jgi:hypothetical protein
MTFSRHASAAVVPDRAAAADALARLASMLWAERELLRTLHFRLVAQQLVIARGETQWIAAAEAEVRTVVGRLHDCEVLRAVETDWLLRRYGLDHDATLGELADVVPEPWPCILRAHQEALSACTEAVDGTAAETERLVRAALAG